MFYLYNDFQEPKDVLQNSTSNGKQNTPDNQGGHSDKRVLTDVFQTF